MLDALYKDCRNKMDSALKKLQNELASVRTGRASLTMFDNIHVDYYGNMTPLQQVAGMANPEPNLITIQPWEAKMIGPIEKAILAANLGLTPSSDGHMIRIHVPPLNEERRKEYVKTCHKYLEAAKTAMRNMRRESNDQLKKMEKDKKISQDQQHAGMEEVQKILAQKESAADTLVKNKEKEILSF
jgi:ribosome recycling factor